MTPADGYRAALALLEEESHIPGYQSMLQFWQTSSPHPVVLFSRIGLATFADAADILPDSSTLLILDWPATGTTAGRLAALRAALEARLAEVPA